MTAPILGHSPLGVGGVLRKNGVCRGATRPEDRPCPIPCRTCPRTARLRRPRLGSTRPCRPPRESDAPSSRRSNWQRTRRRRSRFRTRRPFAPVACGGAASRSSGLGRSCICFEAEATAAPSIASTRTSGMRVDDSPRKGTGTCVSRRSHACSARCGRTTRCRVRLRFRPSRPPTTSSGPIMRRTSCRRACGISRTASTNSRSHRSGGPGCDAGSRRGGGECGDGFVARPPAAARSVSMGSARPAAVSRRNSCSSSRWAITASAGAASGSAASTRRSARIGIWHWPAQPSANPRGRCGRRSIVGAAI